MRKNKIVAILLIVISISPVFSAGMPVFDIENWLYSILQYTQMGQDTINFVNNVNREIELAEKLYKSISEGDLQGILGSLNQYSNRLENSLNRYGVQTEIYSQLNDIASSSLRWGEHIDDPDYFLSVVDELNTLGSQMENERLSHIDAKKAETQEKISNTDTSTNAFSSITESETELSQKNLSESISQRKQQEVDSINQDIDKMFSKNEEKRKETLEEATYYMLLAEQREAEKIVRENMMQNIPKVDVNLTDPFEGL